MNVPQLLVSAAGVAGGAAIGYHLNRRRIRDGAPSARALLQQAQDPTRSALLLAFSAFVGVTIVQDVIGAFRPVVPDLVVLKYLFAGAIGLVHWIFLKRIARERVAPGHER